MVIRRDRYMNMLLSSINNGMIKAVTGIKGCGKSYLLFHLFKEYLLKEGVDEDHIICIAFDSKEHKQYCHPDVFYPYVREQIKDDDMYYVLLDEIQMLDEFESVLNRLNRINNVDLYVTGSHARNLTEDVITEFRGRCEEIRMYPLSFAEYMSVYPKDMTDGWNEYVLFGGLPKILSFHDVHSKTAFLETMLQETYVPDICKTYRIRKHSVITDILELLSSSIGVSTDSNQILEYFSSKGNKITGRRVNRYIDYICDSYVTDCAVTYDINMRNHITDSAKYYFTDIGIRNACGHFKDCDSTGVMENIVYNELKMRGFSVDAGLAEKECRNGKEESICQQGQIDFVCNRADKRYYIQVVDDIHMKDAMQKKRESLLFEGDFFKRVIITPGDFDPFYDEPGILNMNIFDFLLNENSLNF